MATYSLIASFVAVFIVEKALLRTSDGLFDMGALSNLQPDWWRFVAYAFLHEPSGSTFGLQGLPVHLLFNSFATSGCTRSITSSRSRCLAIFRIST